MCNEIFRKSHKILRSLVTKLVPLVLFIAGGFLSILPKAIKCGPKEQNGIICDPTLHQYIQSFGTLLSVSIALGFMYRTFLRRFDNEEHEERLRTLLDEKIDRILSYSRYFGLDGFLDKTNTIDLLNGLKKGNTLWWLITYDPNYQEWSSSLTDALRGGAKVKMLVMSPESEMKKHRIKELLNFAENEFNDGLKYFIEHIKGIEKNTQNY